MERRGGLERAVDILGRVVDVRAQEITIALGSFITFALVLGSYYLIRPIRENIGAEASADQRQLWFLLVFAVMLAAVEATRSPYPSLYSHVEPTRHCGAATGVESRPGFSGCAGAANDAAPPSTTRQTVRTNLATRIFEPIPGKDTNRNEAPHPWAKARPRRAWRERTVQQPNPDAAMLAA